jgi:ribosome-associated toxin RatA of RatAB toxin-antitoxin module
VFDVVSDYDRLGDFVGAIDSSHVIERDSTGVLVRQVGKTTLVIRKTVRMTLRFRPQPPERLWFEIVSGDFTTYFGSWRFEPHPSGTRLTHDITFSAPEHLPGPLVRHVVERDLRMMLSELRLEIARRRQASSP